MMPTEEELKNPCVARLFLNHPKDLPQLPPPNPSVPRPSTYTNAEWHEFQKDMRGQVALLSKKSTDTNSEWREFQNEIRGQVASLNKKFEDLNKEQKRSNKLLRRVLKMLSNNITEKGQDQGQTAPHVSSSQEINVEGCPVESEAFKTTLHDIGDVEDIGVQAAMEFLTADKLDLLS